VTIAIGLIVKARQNRAGAIIFASDSQTTFPGGQKRLDAQKINTVQFSDAEILVAQAGSAELADKTIDLMQQKAKDVCLTSLDSVLDVLQRSVKEVRNHLKELNSGCGYSHEDWTKFWQENSFDLMVGFYLGNYPQIYTIDIQSALPNKVKGAFKAIGCGKFIAEFLLTEYQSADPDLDYGYPAAISVVERTIDNVEGCGRPIWVGAVNRTPQFALDDTEPEETPFKCTTKLFSQIEIGWVVDELKSSEETFKPQQKDMMVKVLRGAWEKYWKNVEKLNNDAEAEMKRRGMQIPPA